MPWLHFPAPEELRFWNTLQPRRKKRQPRFGGHRSCSSCYNCQTLRRSHWHKGFGERTQSAKPTTFAILNAPNFYKDLHEGMITKDLPKGMSIGRDEAGHWATAKLKEYPPGLCLALARGILQAISQLAPDDTDEARVSSQFRELCSPLICTEFGSAYGPDFASGVLL